MNHSLQSQLVQLRDLADGSDVALAVYDAAAEIIADQQAELDYYRDGSAPAADEVEHVLADALRALQSCAHYIEAQGGNPECLRQANAILEESKG